MSIGEVLGQLRADFPDVTISKLRFLETEGLVEPKRTPAGYRKYTWVDVARLRYVLTAQRDHYLPLRVIREHLAALDDSTMPLSAVDDGSVTPDVSDIRLARDELLERSGLDDTALRALLESTKGLCLMNFVELQHLKKVLRHHLNIGEEFGLYRQSVGEYLARLEQNTVIVAKANEERERLGQEGTKNPQQKT